jgi:2-polyprenyl-6-methoxyphenol hydroxylase-like FAD-dependent oxidoreductase
MTLRPGARVLVRGAGPAGATFAARMAQLRPDLRIDVVDPQPGTPGAGVVLPRAVVDELTAVVPDLLDVAPDDTATWDSTVIRTPGFAVGSPAHGTLAVARAALVGHLRRRAAATPGVVLRTGAAATGDGPPPALVVGADGAESPTRSALGLPVARGLPGRTRFLWVSVPGPMPAMFHIHDSGAGMVLLHAYPHSAGAGTAVVEALESTVAALGMDGLSGAALERALGELLAEPLGGRPPTCHTRTWRRFSAVRCARWSRPATSGDPAGVVLGDAAHAMHYSIGMGTSLALQDAVALAGALAAEADLADGLARYEAARRPAVDAAAAEAESSMRWFEGFVAENRVRGAQTAFAIRTRRRANSFAMLAERSPGCAAAVVRTVEHSGGAQAATPGALPFRHGGLAFDRRVLTASDLDGLTPEPAGRGAARIPAADGSPALVAVLAVDDDDRIARSAPAVTLRRELGLPVLYVHGGEPADELDTLIGTGRVDLAVDRADLPAGWLAALGAEPVTGREAA